MLYIQCRAIFADQRALKNNIMRFISILFLVLGGVWSSHVIAQTTTVSGLLTDSKTGEGLPFASVYFTTMDGVTTDLEGRYEISTTDITLNTITFHYLGYKEKTIKVKPGVNQILDIKLKEDASYDLGEVVVKAKKKVKKDTAAITLYRNVVRNKPNNRQDKLDYYSYEEYSKTEFDMFNFKEKIFRRKVLRPFWFVFEYKDSTDIGVPFLPLLLKEQLADVYYRKNPNKKKETLKATRFSGVRDFAKGDAVEDAFPNANVYDNMIDIQQESFLSPFANGALPSYKYFLTDSMSMDGRWTYKLEFTPRRKSDLAFTGHAFIDGETFAIRSIDLYLLDQANINFISDLLLQQNFEFIDGKHWFKTNDKTELYLNLTQSKRQMSVRVLRTNLRTKISLQTPIPDSLIDKETDDNWYAYRKFTKEWEELRPIPLTKTEGGIYQMIDSLQKTRAYKNMMWTGHLFATGWAKAGPIEFGKYYNSYSWNDLEGNRFRLGIRNSKFAFNEKLQLNAYVAYGDKDKIWKYNGGFRYHLPRINKRWHTIGGYYKKDYSNFNFYSPWASHDYILNSLTRGKNELLANSLYLQQQGNVFYEKEFFRGFRTKFSGTHKTVLTWPQNPDQELIFTGLDGEEFQSGVNPFQTVEFNIKSQWSVGLRFNQNARNERGEATRSVRALKPYLVLDYTYAPPRFMGSDFTYHRVELSMRQQLRSRIGRTYYQLEGGRIFGDVPSPLFRIHSGNESFMYNRWSYNMMNNQEYGGDIWASAWFTHRFRGLFFNMIPWNDWLRLRSLVHGKVLYSRVSPDNIGKLTGNNGDGELADLNGVYAEVGVGIENIARFIKVDFMWRLTQRDEVRTDIGNQVRPFGIKVEFRPSF